MKTKLKASILCLLLPMLLRGQEIGVLRMGLDTVGFKGNAAVWGGAEEGGYHRHAVVRSRQPRRKHILDRRILL